MWKSEIDIVTDLLVWEKECNIVHCQVDHVLLAVADTGAVVAETGLYVEIIYVNEPNL